MSTICSRKRLFLHIADRPFPEKVQSNVTLIAQFCSCSKAIAQLLQCWHDRVASWVNGQVGGKVRSRILCIVPVADRTDTIRDKIRYAHRAGHNQSGVIGNERDFNGARWCGSHWYCSVSSHQPKNAAPPKANVHPVKKIHQDTEPTGYTSTRALLTAAGRRPCA